MNNYYKNFIFIIFFFVSGCGEKETADPVDPLVEKIPFEVLFAKDIDFLKSQIDKVAIKEGYENLDLMLKLCREHPIIEVKRHAGRAVEIIVDQKFKLDDPNERIRNQGLSKAYSWWEKHRREKLNSIFVERLIPYLEMEFDDIDQDKFFNEVVRELPASSHKNAAEAIYLLRQAGSVVYPRLHDLLKSEKNSQLVKEKIAFILGGNKDVVLSKYMSKIIEGSDRIEKKVALYQLWFLDDPVASSEHLWGNISQTLEGREFVFLIKTAAGITPGQTASFLADKVRSSDKQIARKAFGLLGHFGFEQHLELMIDEMLQNKESIFREEFKTVMTRLGATQAVSLLLKELETANKKNEGKILNKLLYLEEHIDEFDKISMLKGSSLKRESAAVLLRSSNSKSAVKRLIDVMDLPGYVEPILETLNVITGHDFSQVNTPKYLAFKANESGPEEEIKKRFLKNRARLWWLENKGFPIYEWILSALNESNFNGMADDNHPLSGNEKRLLRRLLETKYPEKERLLNFLIDTGESENISFVVDYIRETKNPIWANVLRERVNNALDSRSTTYALLFCQIAGPEYHRHFKELLRHTNTEISTLAKEALVKWGAYQEVVNLIDVVERGSESAPYVADEILQRVSGLNFGNIAGITTPQRRPIVDQWKSWWRRVHDDEFPNSWQAKEIEYLTEELSYTKKTSQVKRRLEFLTHQRNIGDDVERTKKFWAKHKDSWGTHGAWVTGLLSNNWWKVEAAQQVLISSATPRDVVHMVSLLDVNKPRQCQNVLLTLRILTNKSMGYSSNRSLEEQRRSIDRWREALLEGTLFNYTQRY